ncbi:MAG: NACHT domain-containing protein [Cyanobacteria bacterium P01_F01_bin.53]
MTGLEPLITAAVGGVAVPIFQSLWEGSGKVLGLFGKSLDEKTRQLIFQASKQYGQNYTERHGILKVLGMRQPRPLESIYTSVRFLGEEDIQGLDSVEDLEKAYRQSRNRSFQFKEQTKRSGIKVANEKQFLMVLGGPGAGKSTFSRRIGLEALKGKRGQFKHRCIPVLIELKEFRSGAIDIEHKIAEEFRICGFPDYQKFTIRALEQGKLLVLLDGLDEVPTGRTNKTIRQIQNFVDRYDQNRFITSCRVAAYRHNFRRFTDVAMAEFDNEQIENFINNWFSHDPVVGKDCWKKLNCPENTAAKELTQTPLLLTLICLLYQRARKFPTNRATLYEKALRVLLEEWAGEKGIPQEELYKGLDTRLKETLLSEIAHTAFEEDRLFLPRREVAEQIQDFLEETLTDGRIDGEAVLKSIEVQHGILVARAEGIYSFSHLTLQEYLTAQYIDDHRQIESLTTQHLTDLRWREVFLLVAGLMRGGADELLLQMEKQNQTYINTPKLRGLLEWSEQVSAGSAGNYISATKRAVAIFFAINLDLDRYRYRNLDLNLDLNLAHKLAINLDLDHYRYRNLDLNLDRDSYYYRNLDRALKRSSYYYLDRYLDLNLTLALDQANIFQGINLKILSARLEALKAKFPDRNQPLEVRKAFIEQVQKTWLKTLQLNLEQISLSKTETKALNNYLETNIFILQCERAAVRVSRKIREEIKERILLPPSSTKKIS